jgi:hypothetical protein
MNGEEFSHLGEKLAQVRAAIAATAMHGVEDQFTIISSGEYLKP